MNTSNIIDKVTNTVSGGLNRAVSQLQGTVGEPAAKKLTTSEQVERFLSMSDSDFESLRAKKGPAEFGKYVEAMTRLAGRQNG